MCAHIQYLEDWSEEKYEESKKEKKNDDSNAAAYTSFVEKEKDWEKSKKMLIHSEIQDTNTCSFQTTPIRFGYIGAHETERQIEPSE